MDDLQPLIQKLKDLVSKPLDNSVLKTRKAEVENTLRQLRDAFSHGFVSDSQVQQIVTLSVKWSMSQLWHLVVDAKHYGVSQEHQKKLEEILKELRKKYEGGFVSDKQAATIRSYKSRIAELQA